MATELSAGKFVNLKRLADPDGIFHMLAVDQRGSIQRMIEKATGGTVGYDDIAAMKRSLTRILGPLASATLTDAGYGFPNSLHEWPHGVGMLLAYEQTGYEKAGKEGRERKTVPTENWSVAKIKRAGANAVKLLLFWRPEASQETRDAQMDLTRRVGEACRRCDLPFLVEPLSYPLLDEEMPKDPNVKGSNDHPVFARNKPRVVIDTIEEFCKPEYGIDILKLEFPAELKYCKEFADGAFDGRKREAVYDLAEVKRFCREVDAASSLPWVILSAGVGIDEFVENIRHAADAGASGYLCGRAIWKEAAPFFPDMSAVDTWLATTGRRNYRRVKEAAATAVPWYEHKRFGGLPNAHLEGAGETWHATYEEAVGRSTSAGA